MAKEQIYGHNIYKCIRHQFYLRPLNCNLDRPLLFNASFCSQQWVNSKCLFNDIGEGQCLNCPTFNHDNSSKTSTFVLKSQANQFLNSGNHIIFEHQNVNIPQEGQKSIILIPKPKSKYRYCSVCQKTYEDYKSHIEQKNHENKIKRSNFNNHILELVKKYRKIANDQQNKKQLPKIRQFQSTKTNDSDDVEIIENPCRKIRHVNELQQIQYGWGHWLFSHDYAKQFVQIFRGQSPFNQRSMLYPYNGMGPYPYHHVKQQKMSSQASKKEQKVKDTKAITVIVIDD